MKLIGAGLVGLIWVLGCDSSKKAPSDAGMDSSAAPDGSYRDADGAPEPVDASDADATEDDEPSDGGDSNDSGDSGDSGALCMPPGDADSDVEVCSSSPTLTWSTDVGCVERCPLSWGCDSFEIAKAKASVCADAGPHTDTAFVARGCGYRIITRIERDPVMGFYDEDSGELVATWHLDDTVNVDCSGAVPLACRYLDTGPDETFTDVEYLCHPPL